MPNLLSQRGRQTLKHCDRIIAGGHWWGRVGSGLCGRLRLADGTLVLGEDLLLQLGRQSGQELLVEGLDTGNGGCWCGGTVGGDCCGSRLKHISQNH